MDIYGLETPLDMKPADLTIGDTLLNVGVIHSIYIRPADGATFVYCFNEQTNKRSVHRFYPSDTVWVKI